VSSVNLVMYPFINLGVELITTTTNRSSSRSILSSRLKGTNPINYETRKLLKRAYKDPEYDSTSTTGRVVLMRSHSVPKSPVDGGVDRFGRVQSRPPVVRRAASISPTGSPTDLPEAEEVQCKIHI
jgi:hypothetical protein